MLDVECRMLDVECWMLNVGRCRFRNSGDTSSPADVARWHFHAAQKPIPGGGRPIVPPSPAIAPGTTGLWISVRKPAGQRAAVSDVPKAATTHGSASAHKDP